MHEATFAIQNAARKALRDATKGYAEAHPRHFDGLKADLIKALTLVAELHPEPCRQSTAEYANDLRAIHAAYAAFMGNAIDDLERSCGPSYADAAQFADFMSDARDCCIPDGESVSDRFEYPGTI